MYLYGIENLNCAYGGKERASKSPQVLEYMRFMRKKSLILVHGMEAYV